LLAEGQDHLENSQNHYNIVEAVNELRTREPIKYSGKIRKQGLMAQQFSEKLREDAAGGRKLKEARIEEREEDEGE
jgi:hypothetical protein